jgi:3-methyladenine DNA glycosylase AlkD
MTAKEILENIRPLGSASYKKTLFNHGVREPCFGVKIADLKKLQRQIKKDYQLALDLYDTGIYDAMYLAGLIADDERMSKEDLQDWVAKANCGPLCGATVPWVAAGSTHGWELALEWIDSDRNLTAVAGWASLSSLVSVKEDAALDLDELKRLLHRVELTIHQSPDIVRYQMNAFVIAVGAYVKPLTDAALLAAETIGPVMADLGNNSCQVPSATERILKSSQMGVAGKKRKSAKC